MKTGKQVIHYLFLSAEDMPEDIESFTLSVDNIYGTPWNVYTLDINGEGEMVPSDWQPFTAQFGPNYVLDGNGAYLRIVAPEGMNSIGYLRVVYSYEDYQQEEIVEEYDEYINDIPVVATVDWDGTTFTTNCSEVYVKVLSMADGGFYNFEATSTVNKTMYVYLPSDMDTVVASDTYPDTLSRVFDFMEYDESGYAYVKLVSSSGSPLGTVTCSLSSAPMPMME